MLEIGRQNLPLMISAVRNAVAYAELAINDPATADVEDWEEYLVSLDSLADVLKAEYERLAKLHPEMISYDELFMRPSD